MLLMGHQGLEHFFRYRPLLPIGWNIVQTPIQRQQLLVQYKQQTNPLLSVHLLSTLTPLEISRKDKNKQLTLLSQLNSHKPQEIHFLHYKIIREPKKFKKWSRPPFRPETNHTCHHSPNPSRETVPLKVCVKSNTKLQRM
jgi:hypothetical protein